MKTPNTQKGKFVRTEDGAVEFVPDENGNWEVTKVSNFKTAEEVLFETTNGNADYISVNICLEAMKKYANQKLDEATEKAFAGYKENGLTNTANNARQVIINLKDQI